MDVLFCLVCGATSFLCALAVDQGRLRLFQAVFQGLGAWAAIAGLDPLGRRGGPGGKRVFSGEGGRSFGKESLWAVTFPRRGGAGVEKPKKI